ncbi:NACHT domain-containing NTPase [Pimelobacter sp. 30-1]|uniref:NACHT domain-containing protein n=1 Tax=Pimelobacter sp. 30-1 TaxID=2004991 RepID=UPI001C0481CF|nr:NACHT domain-containing protein [Pimelobacter sp. 30-1]MBU2694670.1 hypothetical protein [Pimelobacter sp. 30-1]
MPFLETLTLTVGASVSNTVLKIWLRDSPLALDLGQEATGLLRSAISDFSEHRRAKRQFDAIADQVASKLEPMFTHEFRSVPEYEVNAAVTAVGEVMTAAVVGLPLLIMHDLEPASLEGHIRSSQRDRIERERLSEAGSEIFRRVLTEACNYVVEISTTLPEFGTAAAVESLRRESQIIDLVRTVLDRLPDLQASVVGSQFQGFERQYVRDVARKLDQLELFGVDASPLSRRYALTVAYITLSSNYAANEATRDSTKDDSGDTEYVRVHDALSSAQRMFVRGQAGSGKTTLLRWLAVRAARQDFPEALASWNGRVPFFLELRRYVDRDLPAPGEFVAAVAKNLAEEMPAQWVHSVLREGRALVLVDGVDEIPAADRDQAREWIADLAATFPDSKYVVTSRPAAAEQDWLENVEFEHCDLEPMTPDDIFQLIDRWHDAVASATNDDERGHELARAATALKARIRDTASLRSLATSPLLCAMLCALNRDRNEQLPKDRMELYRIALEMLLERRDSERKIPSAVVAQQALPDREKRLLLQAFAYWLILNGYSDCSKLEAEGSFARRLRTMQRVSVDGRTALRYFLERSGLLREAVVGRVDFVHRTFQEYLAAKEAIDGQNVGLLVQNAHLGEWREVVVLAAGHATESVASDLIGQLLDRGDRELDERHRLHLLAVACMGTAVELSEEVRVRLGGALEKLIPPANMTDAQSVASAGEIAVPLLKQFAGRETLATTSAACVRSLTLVGGESALDALVSFGPDDRVTVARELLRSWSYFDPDKYAEKVLRDSRLDYGRVYNVSSRELPSLHLLRRLQAFIFSDRGPFNSAAFSLVAEKALAVFLGASDVEAIDFSKAAMLTHLRLSYCAGFSDLSSIYGLENLKSVGLRGLGISDLAPLAGLPALKELEVVECDRVQSADAIASISGVDVILDVSLRDSIVDLEDFVARNAVRWRISESEPNLAALPEGVRASLELEWIPSLSTHDSAQATIEIGSQVYHRHFYGLVSEDVYRRLLKLPNG